MQSRILTRLSSRNACLSDVPQPAAQFHPIDNLPLLPFGQSPAKYDGRKSAPGNRIVAIRSRLASRFPFPDAAPFGLTFPGRGLLK